MSMNISFDKILDRANWVIRLDHTVYREIANDPAATVEAAVVVAAVALASGLGAATDSFGRAILAILGAFISWAIFSFFTYFFGKNIFGTPTTQANTETLLRTQGYARAPGVLAVFGIIPILGWIVAFVAWIISLITAIYAIRETLGISTGRAIIIGIIAAITSAIALGILGLIFGVGWLY
jgi:hypothetical protein